MVWCVCPGNISPESSSDPCTAGLAATAVSPRGNIPGWGDASNNDMTLSAAKSDVLKHFSSSPSLYDRESWSLGSR